MQQVISLTIYAIKHIKDHCILKSIHNNLSDTLKKYFQSYGLRPKLRPKLLTVKSSAQNHLIDFENNFHRRNVGQIQVNKYVSKNLNYANINSNQTNTLRQQLSQIQKNHLVII
jgi:hypothetical protein